MTKRTVRLVGASAAVLVAVAVAVVSAAVGGSPTPRAPSGTIALLDRARSENDRLPAALLRLPVAEYFGDPLGARFATSDGLRRFFLVPGKGQSLCLVYASGTGSDLVSAGTCSPLAGLLGSGIYFSEVLAPGQVSVALVVPDGYQTAEMAGRSARVDNNVAVLPPGPTGPVRLNGNGLIELTVDIGKQGPGT